MKEVPLSLCEKNSVLNKIKDRIRLDGRDFMEQRQFHIFFGKDYGCCTAILGETKVLAQVTCEVVEPRPSRSNEGKLSLSIHISPMAAPHLESSRSNEIADELMQVLGRNIKESQCIDLESLCILADECVWQFKVDVTVLNHDGNLWDACNLAAVSALRHFHRPDVTIEEDGRVNILRPDEKELVPTFMKKVPICLTFGFFVIDDDCYSIADPTALEERVMSGKLIVGLNPHGEITSLVFPGKVKLQKQQIMNCINRAFEKAKSLAETVSQIVEEDLEKRKVSNPDGYVEMVKSHGNHSLSRTNERIENFRSIMPSGSRFLQEKRKNTRKDKENKIKDQEMKNDDSEEEFPPEMLALSLPEIRAKKNKGKKLREEAEEEFKPILKFSD